MEKGNFILCSDIDTEINLDEEINGFEEASFQQAIKTSNSPLNYFIFYRFNVLFYPRLKFRELIRIARCCPR